MSGIRNEAGLAFLCDREGHVQRVLQDDVGCSGPSLRGETMLDVLDPPSREKGASFLAALRRDGAALDWTLHFSWSDQHLPIMLHMAAMATKDHSCLIVGARTFAAAVRLLGALAPLSNPEVEGFSAVLGEWARWLDSRSQPDRHLFDEFSRLNNSLVTAHRELAKQNSELARLNAEKNQFLGMVAHDLRNPLSVILGYSQFLASPERRIADPRTVRFADAMRQSSEFMLDLIDDLLDISKIEAGKLVLSREPTDLDGLIQQNCSLNQVLAERTEVRLVYTKRGDCPRLSLDQGKINQVLNNLIGNAIKASPPHGVVRIELMQTPEGVRLAITDEGPGIAPNELERIFRPFEQGQLGTTASEKGAGLGLAIANSIVIGHGGRLWAESNPPHGATFLVLFPSPLLVEDTKTRIALDAHC